MLITQLKPSSMRTAIVDTSRGLPTECEQLFLLRNERAADALPNSGATKEF